MRPTDCSEKDMNEPGVQTAKKHSAIFMPQAPSTPATMSKQQATLSKLRSTLSKQHSTLFLPQTATMSNDSIVTFRPFDKVETN